MFCIHWSKSFDDEDFTTTRKYRLISTGSNETLVIEGNSSKNSQHSDNKGEKTNFNQTKVTDVGDIECVVIDDSDKCIKFQVHNLKASSNDKNWPKANWQKFEVWG